MNYSELKNYLNANPDKIYVIQSGELNHDNLTQKTRRSIGIVKSVKTKNGKAKIKVMKVGNLGLVLVGALSLEPQKPDWLEGIYNQAEQSKVQRIRSNHSGGSRLPSLSPVFSHLKNNLPHNMLHLFLVGEHKSIRNMAKDFRKQHPDCLFLVKGSAIYAGKFDNLSKFNHDEESRAKGKLHFAKNPSEIVFDFNSVDLV